MAGGDTAEAEREEAFRELVVEHSRMVFRVAYRITGNEQDAEDVVQEAFLRAYRSFAKFDSRASFSTWIFRIASNCAVDVLRARRRRPSLASGPEDAVREESSDDPSPETRALGGQIQTRVAGALAELTPRERAAFVLRHFEGLPTEEIGRALGIRANAAKQTVFRAVRKLRVSLDSLREEAR